MIVVKDPDKMSYRFSKEEEEHLIHSGILYCQAIENADGVPFQLIFGPQPGDGFYLQIGSGIEQLLGIPAREFDEKRYCELIEAIIPSSDQIPADPKLIREKFLSGKIPNYKVEVLIRTPGGEKKWIQDSSLPLIDEETGKIIGAFGILFDINERKLTRDTLELAIEKAEESDRLKSAFINNISHEIRTPLNAIVGFSALLSESENDPEKRKEFTEIINRSSDHLLDTINHIIEISRIQANAVNITRKEINLNSILQNSYKQFYAKAQEKNISFSFSVSLNDHDANILADGYKLSQILSNLIGNSIKFTRDGEVKFGYKIVDNMLEFFVSDTGIGIKPEHQSIIFNRFYQVESNSTRRFGGTGLGLSISKAYVEILGGKLWFTSQPGIGSIFYFNIPCERINKSLNYLLL
jgi:signal transduction histidine kinase